MTREEMKGFARLDEAVDRLADGRFTLPSDENDIVYNIRQMTKKADELGRPLTDEEAREFIMA